jgi:hypothetical protein
MPPLEIISLFPNPNAPDLGCFVRRKHELERDDDFQNLHVEFNPSIDFSPQYHQCYFRVICGQAAFFQRCLVYMTADTTVPAPVLQTFPPQFVLGGDYPPRPSDWFKFPTQLGARIYWFFGQHHAPATTAWTTDFGVGHIYDIYQNGTLSTVRYDDTGGDQDFNDFVLECAIVGRQSWKDLVQADSQAMVNKAIQKKAMPKLKKLLRQIGK